MEILKQLTFVNTMTGYITVTVHIPSGSLSLMCCRFEQLGIDLGSLASVGPGRGAQAAQEERCDWDSTGPPV